MMGKILTLVVVICSFIVCTCTEEPTSPLTINETGSIAFRISRPLFFENTSKIMYLLSRENYKSITDTILISSSDEKIYTLISNVPIGLWNLEVKALDDSNQICYSETLEIEVVKDKLINVELKWGNNAGKAIYFDGGINYVNVKATTALNAISNALTIEAWVKPLSQYYNTVIAKGSANFFVQLVKYLRPGFIFKGLNIDYSGIENYWGRILLYDYIPEDEWTHIACTYSEQDQLITIYLNGVIKHQCSASGKIESLEDDLRIGARISDIYPEYFKGLMDEIRIWNVARTQSEILDNMAKELDGNENGLIGYWNFNKIVNGTKILDISNHNHNGVIYGNIKLVDSYAF
ncbi:MAG: LamG domain-containing protein [Candidatus Helarchaeota archaeon]